MDHIQNDGKETVKRNILYKETVKGTILYQETVQINTFDVMKPYSKYNCTILMNSKKTQ